jgi:hypothetical protein
MASLQPTISAPLNSFELNMKTKIKNKRRPVVEGQLAHGTPNVNGSNHLHLLKKLCHSSQWGSTVQTLANRPMVKSHFMQIT